MVSSSVWALVQVWDLHDDPVVPGDRKRDGSCPGQYPSWISRLFTFVMVILAGIVTDAWELRRPSKWSSWSPEASPCCSVSLPDHGSSHRIHPVSVLCLLLSSWPCGPLPDRNARDQNVVLSLAIPASILIGAGAIPAGIGFLGELGSFAMGIAIVGGLLLCGLVAVKYLRFERS